MAREPWETYRDLLTMGSTITSTGIKREPWTAMHCTTTEHRAPIASNHETRTTPRNALTHTIINECILNRVPSTIGRFKEVLINLGTYYQSRLIECAKW